MPKYSLCFLLIFILHFEIIFAQSQWAKNNFEKGEIELHVGDFEKAIEYYGFACKAYSNYTQAYFSRGKTHLHLHELAEAERDFNQVIKLDSNRSDAFFYLGALHYRQEDFETAILYLNQALILNPNYAIAYNYRAECYHDLGLNGNAIQDYDRAIELNPDLSLLYFARGRCYLDQENYDQALHNFSQAIDQEPRQKEYYHYRAETYFLRGDYGAAAQDLEYLKALSPEELEKYEYHLLAHCRAKRKEFAAAIQALEQVSDSIESESHLLAERATYFMALSQEKSALKDLEQALIHQPEDKAYREKCAQIYLQTQSYTEASKHYRFLSQVEPEVPEWVYQLAWIAWQKEDKKTAKKYLIQAAKLGYPAEKVPPKMFRLARRAFSQGS